MFDNDATHSTQPYDLVVIGAGITGLNALYAAVQYLPETARVLLLDQKETSGGMWAITYDYVRLHQPHEMFTVGDMTWDWNKPKDYLAARDEVQDHLARALRPISAKVQLEMGFGQTVTHCEEVQTETGGWQAEVTFHANDAPDAPVTIHATRAIHASGLNYAVAQPLPFTSDAVLSVTPTELTVTLAENPDAPIYVVGGGKTGVDTCLAALARDPDRKVTLVNGRGTNFINRDKYFPSGLGRWTSGMLASRLFHSLAMAFDGDNEDDMIRFVRRNVSTDPDTENGVFLFGFQSEAERAALADGLSETLMDYAEDVVDTANGPQLVLRSGATQAVPTGSIFVNCTGSFFRGAEMEQAGPCLSPNDTVMRINGRDGFHIMPSVSGFFMTHALYRGVLRGHGFYTMDHEALFRQNRNAWTGAATVMAYANQVNAVQHLPMSLLDKCGLDVDRWYPLPRRMIGLVKMKAGQKKDLDHCRKVLDRVATRFDVKCAEIV